MGISQKLSLQNNQRDPETYAIIGSAMEVHNQLGHGFLEAVYQEALVLEFTLRSVPFQREVGLEIRYKDQVLDHVYKPDFIGFGSIIVELKATDSLTRADEAQLLNYLKARGKARGILLNFGAPRLEYKRMVWNYKPDQQ